MTKETIEQVKTYLDQQEALRQQIFILEKLVNHPEREKAEDMISRVFSLIKHEQILNDSDKRKLVSTIECFVNDKILQLEEAIAIIDEAMAML